MGSDEVIPSEIFPDWGVQFLDPGGDPVSEGNPLGIGLTAAVQTTLSTVSTLSSTVSTLSPTVSTLSSTVSTLSSTVSTLSSTVSTLSSTSATSANRITAIDANTKLQYLLGEGAAPYLNTGNGGALNLTVANGSSTQVPGLFGNGQFIVKSATSGPVLTSANTSIGESADITLSAWIRMGSATGQEHGIFLKNYNLAGGFTAPYWSWMLAVNSSGYPMFHIAQNSSFTQLAGPLLLLQSDYLWTHLAATYTDSTKVMRLYVNGMLVATSAALTTSIQYGTHGAIYIGGEPTQSTTESFVVSDARMDSVVRNQQYLISMYQKGVGIFS